MISILYKYNYTKQYHNGKKPALIMPRHINVVGIEYMHLIHRHNNRNECTKMVQYTIYVQCCKTASTL